MFRPTDTARPRAAPLLAGLHDPRPAARDHPKPLPGQLKASESAIT